MRVPAHPTVPHANLLMPCPAKYLSEALNPMEDKEWAPQTSIPGPPRAGPCLTSCDCFHTHTPLQPQRTRDELSHAPCSLLPLGLCECYSFWRELLTPALVFWKRLAFLQVQLMCHPLQKALPETILSHTQLPGWTRRPPRCHPRCPHPSLPWGPHSTLCRNNHRYCLFTLSSPHELVWFLKLEMDFIQITLK